MAKRIGQVNENTKHVEVRRVAGRAAKETEIPWTRGPQTRWQKIKRAAVG
jgi:hypothetical protein